MASDQHQDYLAINRSLWNEKLATHLDSAFYDVKGFIEGKSSLNEIELSLLGDVKEKSILHLQCHFGQDTIDLARRGADCVGLDLSDKAIDAARELAGKCSVEPSFVCGDVYRAPQLIDRSFDVVFSSYGTIGWLPDMQRWASVVHQMLKPGGQFIFAEFHPVVWMMNESFDNIGYSYFNDGEIVEETEGTYTDGPSPSAHKSISWNHFLAEVIGALLETGLILNRFDEYDYSPYDCFDRTVKQGERNFQIKGLEGQLPLVYSLSMTKPDQ